SSLERLFTDNFHWLLYDETGNMSQLVQQFENANLSINADVTYIKPAKLHNDSVFILYDVYNKGSHLGGKLNITIDQSVYCNESFCVRQHYLSDLYKRTRLQQRNDLTGITFRQASLVTTMPINSNEDKLMSFLNSQEQLHMDWLSRMGYRLNLLMQECLNFRMQYIWRDQWSLGDITGGALGDLISEATELSSTPFVISAGRISHLFPIMELSQFRSVCIFRTPHNAGIEAGVFLEPFKLSVWLTFAGILVCSGVLLWCTFRVECRWTQYYLDYQPSVLTSCLISFGAACIQGSHLVPNSTGGRLGFVAVMLISFLMYNYYTSIVVSSLLNSPVRSNIKSIQQLADSSLDVGLEDIPFNRVYLKVSCREDVYNLRRRKVEQHDPMRIWFSAEEGMLKVRDKQGYVFISEGTIAYTFVDKYFMPHEICELNEIPFRPESSVYALIHINSTYKELLKQTQLRMLETGILKKFRRLYSKSKSPCYSNNYVISVGMEYAAPLFIALLISFFASLLVLIIELSWSRLRARERRLAK
ncbi:Ir75a, partial [Drosophila busckii]